MPEMSDKELDKLFQEAASGLEPAYDPQDWEMLRARLDGDDKAAFVRRVTLRILVGAMLLSSIWSAWQSGDTKTSPQEAAVVETTTLLSADTDTALTRTVPSPRAVDGTQVQAMPGATTEGTSNAATDDDEHTVRTGITGTENEPKQDRAEAAIDKRKAGTTDVANQKATTTAAVDTDAGSRDRTGDTGLQTTNHRRRAQGQTAATRDENNSNNHTDRTGQVNAKQGKSATAVSNQQDSLTTVQRVAGRPVELPVDKGAVTTEQSTLLTKTNRAAGIQEETAGHVKEDENVAAKSKSASKSKEVTEGTTKKVLTTEYAVTGLDNGVAQNAREEYHGQAVPSTTTEKNKEQSGVNAVTTDDRKVALDIPADEKNRGLYPETQEAVREGQEQTRTAPASDRDRQMGEEEDVYVHEKDNVIGVNGPPMRKRSKGEKIAGEEALAVDVQQHDSTQVKEEQKDTTQVVSAAEEEEKKEAAVLSRWYIKLPVSPDFSTVGYKRPGKPGINIGLLVEFMPVTRLGITAGAIWSRKIYTSKNPEKTYGSGAYQVKADWLDGECRVLDLPLNVTYYIRPVAKTNFSVTAGISSYIMLSEDYTYVVKGPTKDYVYNENFTRKNNDWGSMLNLSIGIQHRLSRRFQVQAEPFLKAPLSGVGEGKVDLVSSGIFFSLKYQL
jgi:hypothetical protein